MAFYRFCGALRAGLCVRKYMKWRRPLERGRSGPIWFNHNVEIVHSQLAIARIQQYSMPADYQIFRSTRI
jgi:hypothetical protein